MNTREIDREIAEKVMGWAYGTRDECAPAYRDGWLGYTWWHDGKPYAEFPHYSTDPAASKLLRERLAEKWPRQALVRYLEAPQHQFMLNDEPVIMGPMSDTEELAVALCALKAVGVEP